MAWLNIRAHARLHLGFIPAHDSSAETGSAAVAISKPELELRMRKSPEMRVIGPYSDEFSSLARRFLEEYAPGKGIEMRVAKGIERHTGLGSGTRMALSTGMGINRLYSLGLNPYEIAEFFGRARNSKAGLETLLKGGFVISHGKRSVSIIPPEEWVFVVAIPDIQHGFFGEKERRAMEKTGDSPDVEEDISYLLIKSIRIGDIEEAGVAINLLDDITGQRFESAQHGKYTKTVVEKVVSYGRNSGAYGAGQSSWGPAVYFLTELEKAEPLKRKMLDFLDRNWGGSVYVADVPDKGIYMAENYDIVHIYGRMTGENRILYKS